MATGTNTGGDPTPQHGGQDPSIKPPSVGNLYTLDTVVVHPPGSPGSSSSSSSSGSGPSPDQIRALTDSYLNMLDQWGIPLTSKARQFVQQAVAGNWSSSTFLMHIRNTQFYKSSFPGILDNNGQPKMSEAQYIAQRNAYSAAAGALGFNLSDKMAGLAFKNDLSVQEFQARYQAERLIKDNPIYFEQLKFALKERGIKFNDHTDIGKFLLGESPKQFYNVWREASAAGAAEMAGLDVQHPLFQKRGNNNQGNGGGQGGGGQGGNGQGGNGQGGNGGLIKYGNGQGQGGDGGGRGRGGNGDLIKYGDGGNGNGQGGNNQGGQNHGGVKPTPESNIVTDDATLSRNSLNQISKLGLSQAQLAQGFKQLADLMTQNLPEAMAMGQDVSRKDFQQSVFGGKGSADARARVSNLLDTIDAYYNEQRAQSGIQQSNVVAQNPGNFSGGQLS